MKRSLSQIFVIAAAVAALSAMLLLSACGGKTSSSVSADPNDYTLINDGVLTIATSPDFPPMEYQEGGDIKGFDIALIKEIADRLDLSTDVNNQAFDALVTQVAGGKKFDVAISSITITDERADQVAFSDPYYDSNLAIVVLADSGITSRADLEGLPIGAQSGSSGEDWAKENFKGADYTPFQETTDMLAALRTGKVKAVVYDEPVALNNVNNEYSDCSIIEIIPTGEQYGIIVNSDNPGLVAAINKALAEMQADGTIDKLKTEWFGTGSSKK